MNIFVLVRMMSIWYVSIIFQDYIKK